MAAPKKNAQTTQTETTTSEPVVQCHMCDWMTDAKPGHVVVDGRVVRCPFITLNVQMDQPKPDRLV